MRARLYLLAVAGAAAAGVAVWLAARVPPDRPTEPGPVLTFVVGASLLGSGLASWHARPDNRLGPIMVATGFAWFAGLLSEAPNSVVYTIGSAVQYVFVSGFIYILLSFPSGRLGSTGARALVWLSLVLSVVLQLTAMLFGNGSGLRCDTCPDNRMQVFHDNNVSMHLLNDQRLFAGILTLLTIGLLIRRWARASAPQRRAVAPVLLAGCAMLLALAWTVVDDLLGDPLHSGPATVFFYASALVPIAVLVVFLQRRLARGGVAGLVVSLGEASEPGDLREALARALGDPSLQLAFWLPGGRRYVGADGRPIELPQPDSGRSATTIQRERQPIAVLIHDPALEHNAELVQSVCAAAGLALENERLQAELRARLVELQASRARLVQATDAERRRLERDLHDGTQQRLVSIAMSLGLLEPRLPADGAAAPIVRETREALAVALAGAARADPRHPPGAAVRARTGRRARGAVWAGRAPHPPALRHRDTPARAARVRRLLLRERGPDQRRQALARQRGPGDRCLRRRPAGRRGRRRRDRRCQSDGRLRAAGAGGPDRSARRHDDRVQPAGPRHLAAGRGAVRVALADDAVILREGLARLLEEAGFEVVGLAGDGDELLALVERIQPDVAVVDIRMPPTHTDEGLRAAKEIRERWPAVGILVLSQHVNSRYAVELLSTGTEGVGYLLKERVSDLEELSSSVRRVGEGGSVLDPAVVGQLVGRPRPGHNPIEELTDRERQVLALMAEGRSNRAIAARLVVTEHTVEKHVRNIFGTLALPQSPDDHRRVRAVVTYLNSQ